MNDHFNGNQLTLAFNIMQSLDTFWRWFTFHNVMMILTVDDQPDLAGCESPESATSSGGQH